MKKRIIALALTVLLCVSLLPYEVFADLQRPIEGISSNSIVGHTNELGRIRPKVELMFAEPQPSGIEDSSAQNGSNKHEGVDFHYQVEIKEHRTNGKSFRYPESPKQLSELGSSVGQTLVSGIPVRGLENGTLYKMSILPYHFHRYDRGEDGIRSEWAPRTGGAHPYEYVLTDFDTRIEGKGASIEVTWEDSGFAPMQYQIGYIQGNYEGQSLSKIRDNNTDNNIHFISPDDIKSKATTYKDPQTGKNRYKYLIEENIATGQMYSAFVLSVTDKIDNRNILQNKETPKVVTATTEIGLSVYNGGQDKIRLEWDPKFIHVPGSYSLKRTQIKEYGVGQESGRTIATLYGRDGADLGYYEYKEPKTSTYYQLVFIYEHDVTRQVLTPEPQTAKVLYVPGELRTKPATPELPKPIGQNTVVTAENKNEFLVPGDVLPGVPLIDYWKNDHTFHVNMAKAPTLNFVWSAYKEDLSLLYDILVTDEIAIANSEAEPLIKDLSFASGQNAKDILYSKDKDEVVGFKHTLRDYYDAQMRKLPIIPNKVYYVKIVAKKQYGDELEPSVPAVTSIVFDSDGEVFAPPTISKPPLLISPKGTQSRSMTIEWLETWYEIMAKDPSRYSGKDLEKAKEWHAQIYTGTTTGPAISFTNKEGLAEHILKNQENLGIVKDIANKTSNYTQNYIDRLVNLGKNVAYEYKFMPYIDLLKGLENHNATSTNKQDVEGYIEMLMKAETDPDQDYGWKKISPKTGQDDEFTQWQQYTQGNLKANTSYVFFIKPYTYDYDGSKLQASLPTWVVGTTLPDGEMQEGIPTVPVLSLQGKGDTHLAVEWTYDHTFDYEVRYGRLENPELAANWPFEISSQIGDPTYVEHGGKAIVKIDGLFPETTYNVWIRAKQKKGQKTSAWSNPVTAKTDLLGAPTSPAGLGPASYQSILEVGRDFKAVDSKHITVEWERNGPDKDLDQISQDSQRVQKEYRYAIELADNPEFIDRQQVIVSKDTLGSTVEKADILSRSMVYFADLIANRPYYIRAKTILIASDKENDREIIMESAYSQFVRIITKPSQDEYDGGDQVNQVIYPNKIEESYDGTKWIYEILDSQKVIDEMLKEGQFRYLVPVEKYRGRYDPKYRVIRMPQPLVTALINRRMELEVRTNILSIQIPAQALEAAMIGTRADGMVEITFETLKANDLYAINMGYEYGFLSIPERMSIRVKEQTGIKDLNHVDALMKIKIKMPHQYDYMYRNLGGYTYDAKEGRWKKGNHQFNKIKMELEYTSGIIGTYAVYEKTRVPSQDEAMSQSMKAVAKKYDILSLGTRYTPNMSVGISEYINIVLGIAENKAKIIPDISPSIEERNRARNSGLYIGRTSPTLTQEAAVSGLVRLYELTSGYPVDPQTNRDVRGVSSAYRSNIQKAFTLGLINDIRPGQSISYQELFDLLEQVID